MRKCSLYLFFLAVFSVQAADLRSPTEVAKNNFTKAWALLPHLLVRCKNNPQCYQAETHAAAWQSIQDRLQELEHARLYLSSNAQEPGLFEYNERLYIRHEMDETKLVIINLERPLHTNLAGEQIPMSTGEALMLFAETFLVPRDPGQHWVDARLARNLKKLLEAESLQAPTAIYESANLEFISHQGSGPFDTYLSMELPFAPAAELFQRLSKLENRELKNRGEAHITVITPVEFTQWLKDFFTMDEIDRLAREANMQAAAFQILCLGQGQARLEGQEERAFFAVVQSPALLAIRRQIHALYLQRGGHAQGFQPIAYYPHITLGFTARDLHESDQVFKDSRSCIANIEVQ